MRISVWKYWYWLLVFKIIYFFLQNDHSIFFFLAINWSEFLAHIPLKDGGHFTPFRFIFCAKFWHSVYRVNNVRFPHVFCFLRISFLCKYCILPNSQGFGCKKVCISFGGNALWIFCKLYTFFSNSTFNYIIPAVYRIANTDITDDILGV